MKKAVLSLFILFIGSLLFAQQQKYALVIGNANYTGISNLTNPVNDANDMETALKGLGFTVDKVLNGNLEKMENAVLNLKRRLGASRNSYGFFFYAGHGVQSNGENFLIPVAADNIRAETQLRDRAVSLQFVLDTMSEAGNELNMIVLDACRDNPFGWARSGSRGLTVVSRAPTGSIVMYATGANSTAADGTGRNGLFTGYLLNNLKTPGLSVFETFDRTMDAVIKGTNGRQHPELSLRFAGATSAYLGTRPSPSPAPQPSPVPTPQPSPTPQPRRKLEGDYNSLHAKGYEYLYTKYFWASNKDPANLDLSIEYNEAAYALYPQGNAAYELTQAYTERGTLHYNAGRYAFAIEDFEKCLKIDPKYAEKSAQEKARQYLPLAQEKLKR